MAAQRRIDLVLDSVKRLLRIGATANLLNLLQKQHPADLAQVFGELQDKEREAAFSLLADRNGRLAMEAVSELGPEARRGAAGHPLRRGHRQAGAGDPLRRRGRPDRPSARRALRRGARPDAPEGIGRGREPARVPRADGRPHHEPECLRAERGHDGGRGHPGAADQPRRGDGVLPLRRGQPPAPRGRGVAPPPAARVAGDAAQTDHDRRSHQRPRRHGPGRSGAAGGRVQPARHSGGGRGEQAGRRRSRWTTSSTSSRTRPPRTSIAWPASPGDERAFTPARRVAAETPALAGREPGDGVSRRGGGGALRGHDRQSSPCWRFSCRSWPAWAATRARRR